MECLLRLHDEHYELEDYQSGVPRWCTGCGDNAILTAVQRLCRDEELPPEKTVFISGIGCSSRFPHYMKTYGLHGIHGRALPIAEGVKMARPDLSVFVNTGDGDCCSIGAAHWIHAIRYNMNLTVMLHDNQIYGLTKKQASPTSPIGLTSATTPRGAWLEALNPLTVTLGVQNVSFVAQVVDWIPDVLYDVIAAAFHHKGLSFVRILQRCPEWLPKLFEPFVQDPSRIKLLHHARGLSISPGTAKIFRTQEEHDPRDLDRARMIASDHDPIPVGILYQNPDVPCYEDVRHAGQLRSPELIRNGLEAEFDKVTIWPQGGATEHRTGRPPRHCGLTLADMQGDSIMQAAHQAQVTFYLTGQGTGDGLDAVAGLGLRPALLAGYRDLTELRYDFPLVLLPNASDAGAVRSLTELFDAALEGEVVPERLRHHAERMEREMRRVATADGGGTFATLWQTAAQRLTASPDDGLADSLAHLRAKLPADGEVVECDAALPGRFFSHAAAAIHRRKAGRFHAHLTRLTLKLSDILRADFARSAAGHSAESLRAAIGQPQGQAFDFAVMSRMLASVSPPSLLPESRRERIRWLLSVLQSQRFYPPLQKANAPPQALPEYGFVFGSCSEALEAWNERLPRLVELIKAMTIAELEVKGEYREEKHDALFANFGANSASAAELGLFPDYQVRLDARGLTPVELTRVLDALAAGLPLKILLQTDDILVPLADDPERASLGLSGRTLASTAVALGETFVLQSTGSNLPRLRERLFAGLAGPGPALFFVFSGAGGHAGDIPPYLVGAAAMESRAFPAFVYDPPAGVDWATRFSVAGNPQPEQDWPVHPLAYEDGDHQSVAETVAFTAADFLACDRRYATHFARLPRAAGCGQMVAAAEAIAHGTDLTTDRVPYVLMVDAGNRLHKVMTDNFMIREARRIGARWRSLRELGGIHNSHAERLLARERAAWAWEQQRDIATAPAVAETVAPAGAPEQMAEAVAAEPEHSSDEPYIETARCSSCNECTQINNKMFAYNRDKQAYIVDPAAGTYRQLVEAAESCQVCVIHPGKPRNPGEAGLDELLRRAEPFR
jgi:pyruvate/2-oxoacid:ferredoxin oxidoreductase beta subunit